MIILRQREFGKRSDSGDKKDKLINTSKNIAGLGGIAVGGKILDDVYKKGELSGRIKLYHGTKKEAAEKIKEEGLKTIHALDKDNITSIVGDEAKEKQLVYLAKKRRIAAGHALPHMMAGDKPGLIRVSIPYEEYKKMEKVANPEFGGAKNWQEYAKMIKEGTAPNSLDNLHAVEPDSAISKFAKKKWDSLSGTEGTSGSVNFKQDIGPEKIKGSKKFEKLSAKELKNYIKNSPKRFLKGVGKTTVGVGATAGGILKKKKKRKKDKEK